MMSKGVPLATLAPLLVGALLLVSFVVTDLSGVSFFTYSPALNMAEAAAMADASTVLRHLRAGEDPAAIVPVRPDVISSSVTRVTTLEAAIWGRTVELVRLLDRNGAIRGDEARRNLACLSEALKADPITEYLAPGGTAGCEPEDILRQIQARSH
jgi:hypothetical protein